MAHTGWMTAGTASNVASGGTDNWNNPMNCRVQSDASYACYIYLDDYNISNTLRVTNFGAAIPAGSTLDGIRLRVYRKCNVNNIMRDKDFHLRKTSGQVGDNKANVVDKWTEARDVWFWVYYGAADDTWNSGLTIADINSSDFGIDLIIEKPTSFAGNQIAQYDVVNLIVYYTEGASGYGNDVFTVPSANIGKVFTVETANISKVFGV